MIGRHNATKLGTGRNWGIWPVLGVLLAAVLVPTACVLWFMNAAMRNERLAVRESVIDYYRDRLQEDHREIAAFWSRQTRFPDPYMSYPGMTPSPSLERYHGRGVFTKWGRDGVRASMILLDQSHQPAYPRLPESEEKLPPSDSPAWKRARILELEQGRYEDAAREYSAIAEEAGDLKRDLRAQALLGQARCLARAGKTHEGIDILLVGLSHYSLLQAQDPFGRVIWFSGQLLALQLMDRKDDRFLPIAKLLRHALNAEESDGTWRISKEFSALPKPLVEAACSLDVQLRVPSSQRMFIMESLTEMRIDGVDFPILPAMRLATEYLSADQPSPTPLGVTPTNIPGIWQMGTSKAGSILLFRQEELISGLKTACRLDALLSPRAYARIELPDQPSEGKEPIVALPLSEHFPGWRLAYYFDGPDPFAAATQRSNAVYLWTGMLGIASIAVLAVALAAYLGRQMRLTRLKNDLIATVSHELKTPLASMRVLVDTLREGRCTDARQASEYFDLIAHENERLTRLIDNFLTFSRMERNKRAFDFDNVDVADAARAAVAAVRERFSSSESRLDVDLPADLPQVRADRDALVTVLLNLLDNAWKYSGDGKSVKVRAYAADGSVCIEVSDNGVGISHRALSRIFDKFYQVDQTLARKAGGCGLGLAIVKFILDAHGGSVSVKSLPGKGSTFTVRLPAGKKEKFSAETAED